MYIRRAYVAYELHSLQHSSLPDGHCVVEFRFLLPRSHPNRLVLSGERNPISSARYNSSVKENEAVRFTSIFTCKNLYELLGRGLNDLETLCHKLLYNKLSTILADNYHSF